MDHIQHQGLELVAVRSFGLDILALLIHVRDLLLDDMQRELFVHDPLQILYTEEVVQDDAEVVRRITLLVLRVHQLGRHVVVFDDGRLSVLKAQAADLLIRSGLADNFGAGGTAGIDRRADEDRIRHSLQNVVDCEAVQPLDAQLMHNIQKACAVHGNEPAAVSVRGGGNAVLLFQIDLSVIVGGRCHLLLEEPDPLRIIAEIVVLLHESDGRIVILVAGHDEERDCNAVRSVHDIHEVLDQPLHDIDVLRDADIVHALRIVAAEASPHAAREQYRADLRLLHGVDADPEELLLIGLDLVQFHRAQRGNLTACRQLIPVVYKVDHREIQSLDLIQQGALLLLIQLIKVAKRMLLAIFCQLLQCLFIRKHCLFPPFFMFLLYCLITQRLRLPAARFFASSSKNFCCSTTSSLLSK